MRIWYCINNYQSHNKDITKTNSYKETLYLIVYTASSENLVPTI